VGLQRLPHHIELEKLAPARFGVLAFVAILNFTASALLSWWKDERRAPSLHDFSCNGKSAILLRARALGRQFGPTAAPGRRRRAGRLARSCPHHEGARARCPVTSFRFPPALRWRSAWAARSNSLRVEAFLLCSSDGWVGDVRRQAIPLRRGSGGAGMSVQGNG